jgi:DNA repair ATPase RecN
MDQTAQAIHAAAVVGAEISSVISFLPQQTRWHAEMLMYDLEERRSVKSAVASFDTFATSTERLSKTAEKLPEEIQERVTTVLKDVEEQQAAFRATLTEARATIDGVTEASSQLGTTAETFQQAAANWEKALHVFRLVVQDLAPDPDKPPEAEPGPSDIEILGNTAKEIAAAGVELQRAVAEFHRLTDPEKIGATVGQVDATVDRTGAVARGLANHIAILCVVVIAVFFVGLLAYRYAAGRMGKRQSS